MLLRHDISQLYSLKAAIEQVLGKQAWLDLKECTDLRTWKKYIGWLIDAIKVSAQESVRVYDDEWLIEFKSNLEYGSKNLKSSKNIEELLSGFTAMLLRQVFLQLGMTPNRKRTDKVTMRKENWRLDQYRSVQYVQSPDQIEALFWNAQQKEIGFDRQMELRSEYRASKSKLPFSKWCRKQESRA